MHLVSKLGWIPKDKFWVATGIIKMIKSVKNSAIWTQGIAIIIEYAVKLLLLN